MLRPLAKGTVMSLKVTVAPWGEAPGGAASWSPEQTEARYKRGSNQGKINFIQFFVFVYSSFEFSRQFYKVLFDSFVSCYSRPRFILYFFFCYRVPSKQFSVYWTLFVFIIYWYSTECSTSVIKNFLIVKYKSKVRIKGLKIRQGSNIRRSRPRRYVKRRSLGNWRQRSRRSQIGNKVHQATVCTG